MSRPNLAVLFLLGGTFALLSARTAEAQFGSETRTLPGAGTNGSEVPVRAPTFEESFWRYVRDAAPAYRTWAPFPGDDGEFAPGRSPHGAFVKSYVNRTAAAAPAELPPGSIAIVENYDSDQRTLLAVTVMYRVKGFNAKGADWYWTKYDAEGRVVTQAGNRLAGKVQSCIDCHADAAGGDFVFANDE